MNYLIINILFVKNCSTFYVSIFKVLIKSVVDTLKVQVYPKISATENLTRMADQFFDCLNVSNVFEKHCINIKIHRIGDFRFHFFLSLKVLQHLIPLSFRKDESKFIYFNITEPLPLVIIWKLYFLLYWLIISKVFK